MKTGNMRKLIALDRGYTVLELVVVVALMTTIMAIAIPPYAQWRQSVQYRSTARAIAAMLREARSRAISNNLQYRVQFQTTAGVGVTQYCMNQGNQSAYSSDWTIVVQACTQITNGVTVNLQNLTIGVPESCPPNTSCIDFYPNGTVNLTNQSADIRVTDTVTGALKFTVEVSNGGRIRVISPYQS